MSAKTTIQLKVDKNLNRIFNGHAQIKGQPKQEAHERGMQLYIEESEKKKIGKK